MNRVFCLAFLLVMGICSPPSFGDDAKPTYPRVLAAGDGATLWVVERTGEDQFKILHRNAAAEAGQIHLASESKGRPVAVATGGGTLYLVYADGTLQSLRFTIDEATRMPQYPSRQLPPLPRGTSFVDIAATQRTVLVLVRNEWPPPPAPPAETFEDDAADSASDEQTPDVDRTPKPAEPNAPFNLLRLDAGTWQSVETPEGLTADQHLQLTAIGSSQTPTIIARADNGSVLVVHTKSDEAWASTVYAQPVSESFEALSPMGLCVVVDRLSDTRLSCAILRHGDVLAGGELTVSPANASRIAVTTYRDQPAAVAEVSAQQQLAVAFRDLTASPDKPSTTQVLSVSRWPTAPLNREMMMFALLVVMTVFVLATWRRDPKSALVELPANLVPAEIPRRVLAAMIDMTPPMLIGMLLTGTSDPMFVFANWPSPSGDWSDMVAGVIAIGLFVAHTAVTEALTARTLGKRLVGLRVVTVKGQPPNLWQMLVRNVLKALALVIWFPLILIAFNPARQRLGDLAARTVVVREADVDEAAPKEQD